ncbi:hypothetical protein RB653_000742 [Dictyostelium firmibasis]|uniref:Uncharacterized protein n=1 Tax=Dictyostelium firmibasis TaxID=79012 RepID=A0AAN7U358_9MYCE
MDFSFVEEEERKLNKIIRDIEIDLQKLNKVKDKQLGRKGLNLIYIKMRMAVEFYKVCRMEIIELTKLEQMPRFQKLKLCREQLDVFLNDLKLLEGNF